MAIIGIGWKAVLVNAAGNALEFGSAGKETELHQTDDSVEFSASGNFVIGIFITITKFYQVMQKYNVPLLL